MKKKNSKKFSILFGYSIHLIILIFLVNVVIAYTFRYFIFGATCMTKQQIANDSRCLYIMGNQVYQKGSRSAPHFGHPCGTDVTALVPASHINNPAIYLVPNYIANVCVAVVATPTPKPTATPTQKPTFTPTPTKPIFTPTLVPQYTTAPRHITTTSMPISTPTHVMVPTPTNSTAKPVSPTPTVTPTLSPVISTNTPTIPPSPNSIILNLTISITGVSNGGNKSPVHTTRNVAINIYNAADNPSIAQPVISQSDTLSFNDNPASPTHTLFINPTFSLGAVPAGNYQLWLEIPGYIKKQLNNPMNNSFLFSFSGGQTLQIPKVSLIAGDLDGNNIVDIADYNAFLRCYGAIASTPTCVNPMAGDLNDDGKIDFVDYNIFLYNMHAYDLEKNSTISLTPTVTSSPIRFTPSPIKIVLLTPIPTVTVTPTFNPIMKTLPTTSPVPKKISLIKTIVADAANMVLITKIFDIIVFLILLVTVGFGFYRSKLFQTIIKIQSTPPAAKKVLQELPQENTSRKIEKHKPPIQSASAQTQSQVTSVQPIATEQTVDIVCYVKPYKLNEEDNSQWIELVDNDEKIYGYYKGPIVKEGFAQVKGIKNVSQGKPYIEIAEIIPIA